MIFESVIGRANDDDADVDWVEIDFPQTVRRALRLTSRAGHRVDLLMARGQTLRHGDVVGKIGDDRIAIFVRMCDLLKLHPTSPAHAAQLALELGNLHLATEVTGNHLLTADDGPAREIAERIGVPYEVVHARFHPLACTVLAELKSRLPE